MMDDLEGEWLQNFKFTWSSFNEQPDGLKEAGQGREWILFADHQFLVLVGYVAFNITLNNKQTNRVNICKQQGK